jgi:hypothetical protein
VCTAGSGTGMADLKGHDKNGCRICSRIKRLSSAMWVKRACSCRMTRMFFMSVGAQITGDQSTTLRWDPGTRVEISMRVGSGENSRLTYGTVHWNMRLEDWNSLGYFFGPSCSPHLESSSSHVRYSNTIIEQKNAGFAEVHQLLQVTHPHPDSTLCNRVCATESPSPF